MAVYHIDYLNKRAEIGRIIVDRTIAGGKGYGKDAVRCVVEWGKRNLGIKIFYAQVYTNNLSSMKTFVGSGFKDQMFDREQKVSGQVLLERIEK